MVRVLYLVHLGSIGLHVLAMQDVVDPKKEQLFVIGDPRSERSGYESIF